MPTILRVAGVAGVALALIASTACGTAVYNHQIEVAFDDPSGRLGGGPVDVSIFDKTMGYSEEWARRTMGMSTAATPYSGEVTSMPVQWMWDSTLPPHVVAGLAVPGLQKDGYFVMDIQAARGPAQTATLPFAPYGSYFPEGNQVTPLPVRFESEPAKKGWRIRLTVEVPPK